MSGERLRWLLKFQKKLRTQGYHQVEVVNHGDHFLVLFLDLHIRQNGIIIETYIVTVTVSVCETGPTYDKMA